MAGKELHMRSKLRMVASSNLPYGEQYEGELVSGLRQGRGRYKYRDGSVYVGQWSLGVMHGKGELRSANGTVYTGQWDQGTAHGLGEALYADGRQYVGDWYRGKMHGRGVLIWTKGKGTGRGRAAASVGTAGQASSPQPSSREPHGSGPSPGSSSGTGRGVDRYTGLFHLDKPQGEGRYEYADGSWYEGTWKEGSKHGPGVMVWADGSRYEGKWQYNEMVEPGILFTPGTLAIGVEPPASKDFERLLKTSGPDCALARLRAERQAGQKSKKQRRISNLYADSQGLRFGLPPAPARQAPTDKRPSSTGSDGSGLDQRVGGSRKGDVKVKDEGEAGEPVARPQVDTEHAEHQAAVHALPSTSVGALGSLGAVTSATPTAAGGAAFRPSTTASVHTPGTSQRMLPGSLSPSAAGSRPAAGEAAHTRGAFASTTAAHARIPVHLPALPTLHSPSAASSSPPALAAPAAAQMQVSPPTRAGTASTVLSPLPTSAARGRTATAAGTGVGVSGGPSYAGGVEAHGSTTSSGGTGWQGGSDNHSSTMSYSHGSLPFVGGAEYAPAVNRFASIEAQGMLSPSFTQKIQRTLEAANIVPKAGQLLPPIGTPVPPYVEAVYDYADLEEVACGARATSRALRRRSFLQGPALRANGSLSPQGRRSPSPTGSTSVPETRADTPGTASSTHGSGRQPRKRAGTPGSNRLSLLRADANSAEGGAFASLKTVYFGDADKSNKSFRQAKGDTVMQDRLIAAAAHESTLEATAEEKADVLRSMQGMGVASPAAQGMARKLAEGFELRFTG